MMKIEEKILGSRKTPYSAEDIAKYFIYYSCKEEKPLTNKKLQKLLYYSQAWGVTLFKEPIFKEDIEAWVHGPAVKNVYQQYKKYGYGPIKLQIRQREIEKIEKNKLLTKLLKEVWAIYGKYDADYLEELTHSEDPWQKARTGLDLNENSENVITHSSMVEYYSSLKKAK